MKPIGKANLIHQLILSGLVATKPVSWTHKSINTEGEIVSTKRTGTTLANPLALNVSAESVERMAKRWMNGRAGSSVSVESLRLSSGAA